MPVVWRGEQFKKKLNARYIKVLDITRIQMERDIKSSFGSSGVSGATKGQRRANRSKPGEPPHVDTGRLLNSITSERKGLMAKIGSTIKPAPGQQASYPLILELGLSASLRGERPFLRPALKKAVVKFRRKLKFRG